MHSGFKLISANPTGALEQIYIPSLGNSIPQELQQANQAVRRLSVLHINDLHHQLISQENGQTSYRMAQLAQRVKTLRKNQADDEVMLFVSAGDDHIGSKFDELLGHDADSFEVSAAYTALSAAGLDMSVLGNHEFDKQTELTNRMIRENADFPVLSSNLVGSRFESEYAPCAIGLAKGLRIGFIGLTAEAGTYTHTQSDPGLRIEPVQAALQRSHDLLAPWVDVWVILSHLGLNETDSRHHVAFDDNDLAKSIRSLTNQPVFIVGGHTHSKLHQDGLDPDYLVDNTLILQAGQYGEWLGQARMTLHGTPEAQAELLPTYPAAGAERVQEYGDYDVEFQAHIIEPLRARLKKRMQEQVGYASPMTLINPIQTALARYCGESALANFITDAIVARSQTLADGPADLAIYNATGLTGLSVGRALTYADIYRMMPFADRLILVEMTGQDLSELIQCNAQRLCLQHELTLYGGTADPTHFLERGLLHFSSGIRYRVVPGEKPTDNQVADLSILGDTDFADRTYRVALPSYLAHGRGYWGGDWLSGNSFSLLEVNRRTGVDTGQIYRDLVLDFIRNDAKGYISVETGACLDQRLQLAS